MCRLSLFSPPSDVVTKRKCCIFYNLFSLVGKSFLLKLIIDVAKYLNRKSGDELSKPKVLTIAPTANAASLINGKTIESALGINPRKPWNYVKSSNDRQANLKFLYEDLKLVACDEISMVILSSLLALVLYMLD